MQPYLHWGWGELTSKNWTNNWNQISTVWTFQIIGQTKTNNYDTATNHITSSRLINWVRMNTFTSSFTPRDTDVSWKMMFYCQCDVLYWWMCAVSSWHREGLQEVLIYYQKDVALICPWWAYGSPGAKQKSATFWDCWHLCYDRLFIANLHSFGAEVNCILYGNLWLG